MRVVEIIASITNKSHGPSYSVPRLAEAVARAGADVELQSVGEPADVLRDGVRYRTFRHDLRWAGKIGHLRISRDLRRALLGDERSDVFHTHGLWLAPNLYPAAAARRWGKPFVVSPRGMLGEEALRFSHLQKRLMWLVAQRRCLKEAALLHVTGEKELAEVRALGLRNPVAVIPNGISVPPRAARRTRKRVALSLGRIHPIKGLDRLIRAWSHLGPDRLGWRLRIVGPDHEGYADRLRELADGLDLPDVTIEGPLYGPEKIAAYEEASLFVLPTLSENFAMTVAEALAAGLPVIATMGAPWSGLDAEGCGWWIEHGEEPLARALERAMRLNPATLADMGERGRGWMVRSFSWDKIGADMLEAYRWASAGGARPPTVDV